MKLWSLQSMIWSLRFSRQTDILRKWHYEHVRLTRECSNYSNSDTANCRQQKGGFQGNLIACALNILQCTKYMMRLVWAVNSNSSIWSNYQSCMLCMQLFVRFRMSGSRGKERNPQIIRYHMLRCLLLVNTKAVFSSGNFLGLSTVALSLLFGN